MQEMELFPSLELGWLNGWILFAIWILVQGLSLLALPKDIVKRLFEFDRSSWNQKQKISFAFGKILALIYIVLIALTPMKIGSWVFFIGIAIFTFGLGGLVAALHNFKNTPLNAPVTIGLYRVSRHPQLVMLFIIGLGISLALGSWIVILIRVVSFGFQHAGVLAEEQECLRRFGDSYKDYMERVPRYLLI